MLFNVRTSNIDRSARDLYWYISWTWYIVHIIWQIFQTFNIFCLVYVMEVERSMWVQIMICFLKQPIIKIGIQISLFVRKSIEWALHKYHRHNPLRLITVETISWSLAVLDIIIPFLYDGRTRPIFIESQFILTITISAVYLDTVYWTTVTFFSCSGMSQRNRHTRLL